MPSSTTYTSFACHDPPVRRCCASRASAQPLTLTSEGRRDHGPKALRPPGRGETLRRRAERRGPYHPFMKLPKNLGIESVIAPTTFWAPSPGAGRQFLPIPYKNEAFWAKTCNSHIGHIESFLGGNSFFPCTNER